MKRHTILQVIESDGPGGAETVFADLIRHIQGTEFQSVAVVPGRVPWLTDELIGNTVLNAASTGWPQKRSFDLAYVATLRRLFDATRADIIHAHSFGSAVYAGLAMVGRRAKLIATFHGQVDISAPGRLAALKWLVLRRASSLVCVSESLSAAASATRGIRKARIRTIHNGIDIARFQPAPHNRLREQLNLPPCTTLLGAVGNVRRAKAYDILLTSIATLRDRGASVHLAIAGDVTSSPLVDRLNRLAHDLQLTSLVTFIGYVNDIADFLNGLDMFVLSSRTEGFSIATAQALAVGLPIVATRCGGPEEILQNGKAGLLVEAGSAEALADGVLQVLSDRILRARLTAAARRRSLDEFSVETMVRQYKELYHMALGTFPSA